MSNNSCNFPDDLFFQVVSDIEWNFEEPNHIGKNQQNFMIYVFGFTFFLTSLQVLKNNVQIMKTFNFFKKENKKREKKINFQSIAFLTLIYKRPFFNNLQTKDLIVPEKLPIKVNSLKKITSIHFDEKNRSDILTSSFNEIFNILEKEDKQNERHATNLDDWIQVNEENIIL